MGKYEAKLHSESVNKWTRVIEDKFDIEANGQTPKERITNVLDQLDDMINAGGSSDDIREFVREIITNWYKIGARRGAAEMLKDLMWYEILPDNMIDLKKKLSEPIKNKDSLLWIANLRYIEHPSDEESSRTRVTVKMSYKDIIKKLDSVR